VTECNGVAHHDAAECHCIVGPKRSTLQAMLVNLDGEDDMPALQSGSHSPPRTGNADIDDNSTLRITCLMCLHTTLSTEVIVNFAENQKINKKECGGAFTDESEQILAFQALYL